MATAGPARGRPRRPETDDRILQAARQLLTQIADLLEHRIGRGGTAAMLEDTDPDFTTAMRRRIEVRVQALQEQVDLDVQAGRTAPEVDSDVVVGLLLGAYLAEILRHGSLRDGWLDRTAQALSRTLTPSPVPPRGVP